MKEKHLGFVYFHFDNMEDCEKFKVINYNLFNLYDFHYIKWEDSENIATVGIKRLNFWERLIFLFRGRI